MKIFLKVANDPSEESSEPKVEPEQGSGAFTQMFCCVPLFKCSIMGMPLEFLLRFSHVILFIN